MAARSLDREDVKNIDEFLEKLAQSYSQENVDLVRKAYVFSEKAHEGQIRRSGEPYISHPLGVAHILFQLNLDVSSIITGLLHDTVEDTEVTIEDVTREFGESVAHLVDGVTKISKIKYRHSHEKQGENIRKMIVAMGRDVRVVLVKLADRLHNMRTLKHMPFEKQERIAGETLAIYAPLASRLGISSVKVELEDLSFRYSQPERYYELAQKVSKKRKDRDKYIEEVKATLSSELTKRSNLKFEVTGRSKHLYSIYKKMEHRNVDYDQVYDILAFRVCVNSIQECYEALGVVHTIWKPIPGRFKDFIAMAKNNNYQSLHTTVIGPGAERIEIQIRTFEMHDIAEWGIAAHWKYKQETRGDGDTGADKSAIDKFNWLRELVSLHQQTGNADEFLENVKTDLAESEVYVFTPKGDVKEFPDGATPIDFAYSIHTDVGSKVVAARVNGKMVSLKYIMKNGDNIDIITSNNQTPSKDWLKFCVTSKAKSKIRAFIKSEQREKAYNLGIEILEKSLRKEGYSVNRVTAMPEFQQYLKDQGCNNMDDFYVRVGYGKITTKNILKAVFPDLKTKDKESDEGFIQKALKKVVSKNKSKSPIQVDGVTDMLVRFGKCCNPIPGDPIMGFITIGRGVTVHKADCDRAFEMDPDRQLDVAWTRTEIAHGGHVKLKVISHDISGLLRLVSETFLAQGVNILTAEIKTTRDKKAICNFDIEVRNTTHLSHTIQALQKIKGVIGVTRVKSS